MATATITIRKLPDETTRDAILGWEEGDLIYVEGIGFEYFDGNAWQTLANLGDIA